ncbi:vacuolar protein sorting-associated protein 41 [Tilletiaria anomala UBC 951]|uniref:Vacuolar protein sorting-associated protein 41 n=1 Tax=Tilletiaria anomala (strain ATCC 24038 / CBS 436.72 / UBC 951) TaxID=1037660 RepID=A0A066VBK4_TILAU|nr:vacuolar protein sorting-associated protein 41 [Tilletiaria anomala UBC 951]KDN36144.1 vacuolar protein sorting-associated protein 41 [Tilletiaria anomala UBC 951]
MDVVALGPSSLDEAIDPAPQHDSCLCSEGQQASTVPDGPLTVTADAETTTAAVVGDLPMDTSISMLKRRTHPEQATENALGQNSGAGADAADDAVAPRNDGWLESFLAKQGGVSTDAGFKQQAEDREAQEGGDVLPEAEADASIDAVEGEQPPISPSQAAEKLRAALSTPTTPPSLPQNLAPEGIEAGAGQGGKGTAPASGRSAEVIDSRTTAPRRTSFLSSVFEEEEAEERDEEDEIEPSLKYEKLKGGAADVLRKDTASAMAVSDRFLALGTHAGMIYILDIEGNLVKGFRTHTASILALDIDNTSEFVASAGMDGLVSISALSTSEQYVFDFRRPMRCVALEPNFGRKSTRAFVCGGMAGALLQREKSWFGHKEVVLHAGEGPIWNVQWKGNLIAWANDRGVRIYDNNTKQRITFITPPSSEVRADMNRCSLFWKDARTLLIAWADHIKIAKVKERTQVAPGGGAPVTLGTAASSSQLYVEMVAIYQLDTVIISIAPYGNDFLVLVHITADDDDPRETASEEECRFKRREALPPELRIISGDGEELSSDMLSVSNCARYQCNDYLLVPAADALTTKDPEQRSFFVVTPTDIIIARPRTRKDHIDWLLDRRQYAQALSEIEAMGSKQAALLGYDSADIGRNYLKYLVEVGNFLRAARVAGRILGRNAKAWEDWVFLFVERGEFQSIIPFIPIEDPTLSNIVYDMVLAHYLHIGSEKLLETVQAWPPNIYSTQAVVRAIEDKLQHEPSSQLLMESIAVILIANRQPGKALPYYLRLRKPDVFKLILEHNLFSDVRDQALSLIEFDEDISADAGPNGARTAIQMLVDHKFSIPIHRVVPQLESSPQHLHLYLDALFRQDPQSVTEFSDQQVSLYAEYQPEALMPYLRAMSSYYDIEKAYQVCKAKDLVPEMVFLLGRVGDNKRALNLIIERLADVERAIDFAKEQNDDDLWEDLLKYSETRPAFIRGLLENVGAEIDPLRLIRRIKDGLEIPGLKPALIKILQEFNLQLSLLDGCAAILYHDGEAFSQELRRAQRHGMHGHVEAPCSKCGRDLYNMPAIQENNLRLELPSVFCFCRHVFHLTCLVAPVKVPKRQQQDLPALPLSVTQAGSNFDQILGPERRKQARKFAYESKLKYETCLRAVLRKGCPLCAQQKHVS